MALVTLSAGCLSFIIAGIAVAVGLFIDSRLGTVPRWTLIFLVGSLPFSIGSVLLLVRRAILRFRRDINDLTSGDDTKDQQNPEQ